MTDYVVTTENVKKNIVITSDTTAVIDGVTYNYYLKALKNGMYFLSINNKLFQLAADITGDGSYNIFINGHNFSTIVHSAAMEKALIQIQSSSTDKLQKTKIHAPMPGMILRINKKEGDVVEAGEPIIILEAMKMENIIHATAKGIIRNILVVEGNAVEKGAILFNLELL
jgi:biotin carboxyl carrier protein